MKVLLDMESKPQAKECSLLNWTLITSPWIVLIDILLKKLFNHSFYSSHNFDFTVSLPIKYSIKQNWTNDLFHEISHQNQTRSKIKIKISRDTNSSKSNSKQK